MTAVTIEIGSSEKSSDVLIGDVFLGPLAGRVALAHIVEGGVSALLEDERYEPELYATKYVGAPITGAVAALAKRSAGREITVWCAVRAGFPIDGEPAVASYLRFAVPDSDRMIPLAVLVIGEKKLTLTFAAAGAPFVPPPRVDDGGELDQAWARSAETSRAWLAQAFLELRGNTTLTAQITGLDGFPS